MHTLLPGACNLLHPRSPPKPAPAAPASPHCMAPIVSRHLQAGPTGGAGLQAGGGAVRAADLHAGLQRWVGGRLDMGRGVGGRPVHSGTLCAMARAVARCLCAAAPSVPAAGWRRLLLVHTLCGQLCAPSLTFPAPTPTPAGVVRKGDSIVNVSNGKRIKVRPGEWWCWGAG